VEERAVLVLHITEEALGQIQFLQLLHLLEVVAEVRVRGKLQLPVVLVEAADFSIKTAQQEQPLKVMMAQTQQQLALILVEVAVVLEVTAEPSQQTQVQEMVVVE
jgi:hypothetical protein